MDKHDSNEIESGEIPVSNDLATRRSILLAKFSPQTVKIIEIVALVFALCIVIGLFTLPVVFYCLVSEGELSSTATSQSAFINENSSIPCSSLEMTWSKLNMSSHHCNVYEYTGTICRNVLYKWHQCAVGSGDITINTSIMSQDILESDVQELNDLLAGFTECRDVAIPFLCQYYFPLKTCTTDNIYTASKEDCIHISTTVCASPWNIAVNFGKGDRLPKCNSLPYALTDVLNDTINITDAWEDFNITCREDFYQLNNTCLPRCDKFEVYTHAESVAIMVSQVVASSIVVCTCLLIVILSIKDYKIMCRFPSLFLQFMMVGYLVGAITVIIVNIDRSGLLCSSISLEESLNNPTIFCSLSGAVYHYVIVNTVVWWFFHLSIFLYQMMFPFHAQQAKYTGKLNYVFAMLVLLGIVIPLPAVIMSLSIEKHQYTISSTVCVPSADMWFHSTTLVFTILLGAGICFLIIIFFIIHRHQGFKARKQGKLLNTVEKKLLAVFIIYIIFGVYTLVDVAINLANSDKFVEALTTYFKCELSGHVPDKCDRSEFELYTHPYVSVISNILLGLLPLSILNYVLKFEKVKQSLFRCYTIGKSGKETTNTSLQMKTPHPHNNPI